MTPCLYSLVCHVIVATGLLLGPRGSTLKRMEDETNCRILLRGRGASREGDADEFEPMHVVIEAGSDDALEEGKARINQILFDPAAAQRLKDEQRKMVRWSCVFPSAGSGVAWWWWRRVWYFCNIPMGRGSWHACRVVGSCRWTSKPALMVPRRAVPRLAFRTCRCRSLYNALR